MPVNVSDIRHAQEFFSQAQHAKTKNHVLVVKHLREINLIRQKKIALAKHRYGFPTATVRQPILKSLRQIVRLESRRVRQREIFILANTQFGLLGSFLVVKQHKKRVRVNNVGLIIFGECRQFLKGGRRKQVVGVQEGDILSASERYSDVSHCARHSRIFRQLKDVNFYPDLKQLRREIFCDFNAVIG